MTRHNSEILKLPAHLVNCYNSKLLSPISENKGTRDRPYEYYAMNIADQRSESRESKGRKSIKRRPYVKGFSNLQQCFESPNFD